MLLKCSFVNCSSFVQRFLFLENCAVKNILKYLQGQLRKLEPFNHMKLMVVGLQVGLFLFNLYLDNCACFFEGAQNHLNVICCGQTSSYFLKLMIYLFCCVIFSNCMLICTVVHHYFARKTS